MDETCTKFIVKLTRLYLNTDTSTDYDDYVPDIYTEVYVYNNKEEAAQRYMELESTTINLLRETAIKWKEYNGIANVNIDDLLHVKQHDVYRTQDKETIITYNFSSLGNSRFAEFMIRANIA